MGTASGSSRTATNTGPRPGTNGSGTVNYGGLGLTTGSTWHGNTAYGSGGGHASGFATRTGGNDRGPGAAAYSNFRDMSGRPMFSGSLGNTTVVARSAGEAARALQQAASRAYVRPTSGRVGGLLEGEDVAGGSIPQSNASAAYSAMFMRNPTAFPAGATGWRQGYTAQRADSLKPVTMYAREWGPIGAFANSFYGNPRLGTPSLATGLGKYASAPTLNNSYPMLGGGGSLAIGTVPGGYGSWTPAAQQYYGGYTPMRTGFTHSLTGITN